MSLLDRSIVLSKPQLAFFKDQSRETAFIGGVGSGKTFILTLTLLSYAVTEPGALCIIAAPTYTMLRDIDLPEALRQLREYFPGALKTYRSSSPMDIEVWARDPDTDTLGTSTILFRSTDDDGESLRGISAAFIGLDEASMMRCSVYDIALGRLRQAGYPPYLRICSTPRGKTWLYEAFGKSDVTDRRLIRSKTADNVANVGHEFIRSLERQYSGRFRAQELDGEFVSVEGRIYQEFDQSTHVRRLPPTYSADSFRYLYGGIDTGFTDATCILVLGITHQGQAWVVDGVYKTEMLPDDIVGEVQRLKEKWTDSQDLCPQFYIDPSNPTIIELLKRRHIKALPTDNNVNAGISSVQSMLTINDRRPGLYIVPQCVKLIESLERYSW